MCHESVEQRGSAGTGSAFFMAINEDDIIYVLTKEDVDGVAKTIGLSKLSDVHYRMARKYIHSFCSDGVYTWVNAFIDALKDADEELRGGYGNVAEEKEEVS